MALILCAEAGVQISIPMAGEDAPPGLIGLITQSTSWSTLEWAMTGWPAQRNDDERLPDWDLPSPQEDQLLQKRGWVQTSTLLQSTLGTPPKQRRCKEETILWCFFWTLNVAKFVSPCKTLTASVFYTLSSEHDGGWVFHGEKAKVTTWYRTFKTFFWISVPSPDH